ncbi:MAG: RDD family protein [Rhizobacter sp.]|nr:RDD family protein [Chlorobiales bacterium]
MESVRESIGIQTAQNIEIDYEIASVWDRVVATLFDYFILAGYIIGISLLFFNDAVRDFTQSDIGGVVVFALYMPVFFYDLLCEIFLDGQSFGKKIRQIKVVKLDGSQPSFIAYLLRWMLKIVDSGLFSPAVAILVVVINGKGQRLGDIAAGTAVIKLRSRISLDDTILARLNDSYTPVFSAAGELSDGDLSVIKEVLTTARADGFDQGELLLLKAKTAISHKMNISSEMPPKMFLETVMKDYNAIKGHV